MSPSLLEDMLIGAAASDAGEVVVKPFVLGGSGANELLFVLKPEAFLLAGESERREAIRLVLDAFARFGCVISGCKVFSGERLAELGIMDRHYGFMNRLSREASTLVDYGDVVRAAPELGLDETEPLPVIGGHEALQRDPRLDAATLTALWATKEAIRLRGGFYVQVHDVGGERVLLVNGFHPAQIEHFTAAGRKTTIILLHSDTAWRTLRRGMLGDGFPEHAAEGSIRREVLRRKSDFGLESVTIANNFAHLSAGPFEALFEIENFLGSGPDLLASNVARAMASAGLDSSHVRKALVLGPPLFAATEEMDTPAAVLHYRDSEPQLFGLGTERRNVHQ